MNNIPVFYDYKNAWTSQVRPSTTHSNDVYTFRYFQKYLLQKAMSVFKFTFPKEWDVNYCLYSLFELGNFAVFYSKEFGVIPQNAEITGYNVFYNPYKAIITNPLFETEYELTIGKECVLFHLQPDYSGIMDIVNYYADLLSLCVASVTSCLTNSKITYAFACADSKTAETFKKIMDEVQEGNPAVFISKKLYTDTGDKTWDVFFQNVGQNYIADRVLSDMRKIENMFATDIGIPNANTDKRERLLVDEVNANNAETGTRCQMWLDSLKKSAEMANEMFDLNLKVDWRVKPFEEANNGNA